MTDNNQAALPKKIILPHRKFAYLTVLLLIIIGALCTTIRYLTVGPDQALPTETSWHITCCLEFKSDKREGQIFLALPIDNPACRIFKSRLDFPKTPSSTAHLKSTLLKPSARHSDRELKLIASEKGKFRVIVELGVHSNQEIESSASEPIENLPHEVRTRYLANESGIQVKGKKVLAIFEQIHSKSISRKELVGRFFEHVYYEVETREDSQTEDAVQALRNGEAGVIGKTRAFVALCRTAGIPARLVSGIELKETDNVSPRFWAEAFMNNRWKPFDLQNGYEGEIPHHYLVMRHTRHPFARGVGISGLQKKISISEIHPATGLFSSLWPEQGFYLAEIFSPKRMPLEMHSILTVILLFPLAALLAAFFRTIIGIETVGNFTPALLALSCVYSGWWIGVLILFSVVVVGLLGRAMLDQMKLLLLPRLSVVLTVVIIGMIFAISIVERYALAPTTDLILLPMVITTMIVERFYIAEEEQGVAYSLWLLAGTAIVAVFCYLVLSWDSAGQLLLGYPELHFFTIAALILLGGYRGYRLSEIWRFRALR